MSVVPHELSFHPTAEAASPAVQRRAPRVVRVIRALPRIILNMLLAGVLGLVLLLMWAPSYIDANERSQREWRRPPDRAGWWGPRRQRTAPARPERANP